MFARSRKQKRYLGNHMLAIVDGVLIEISL